MIQTQSILSTIYQIWYDEKTKADCWPQFRHYHNETLTPFFENSVIYKLLSDPNLDVHSNDWFGVLSPKFVFKTRGRYGTPKPEVLTATLQTMDADVLSFCRHQAQTNIVIQAGRWHKDFLTIFPLIFERAEINYDLHQKTRKSTQVFSEIEGPKEILANVLQNAVIARKWVWDRYFSQFLKPVMDVMMDESHSDIQELIWRDSGYKMNLKQLAPKFKASFGVPYYPYHTFICERLWTAFLNVNPDVMFNQY